MCVYAFVPRSIINAVISTAPGVDLDDETYSHMINLWGDVVCDVKLVSSGRSSEASLEGKIYRLSNFLQDRNLLTERRREIPVIYR